MEEAEHRTPVVAGRLSRNEHLLAEAQTLALVTYRTIVMRLQMVE